MSAYRINLTHESVLRMANGNSFGNSLDFLGAEARAWRCGYWNVGGTSVKHGVSVRSPVHCVQYHEIVPYNAYCNGESPKRV